MTPKQPIKIERPSNVVGVSYLQNDIKEMKSLIHHFNCELLSTYLFILKVEDDGQGGVRIRPVEVTFNGAVNGSASVQGAVYYVQGMESSEINEEVTDANP